jgi:hypothetical protein
LLAAFILFLTTQALLKSITFAICFDDVAPNGIYLRIYQFPFFFEMLTVLAITDFWRGNPRGAIGYLLRHCLTLRG